MHKESVIRLQIVLASALEWSARVLHDTCTGRSGDQEESSKLSEITKQ